VKGGRHLRSQMFAELQSHYLFDDRFGRPGKGNDKGKVEGLVGFVRRRSCAASPPRSSSACGWTHPRSCRCRRRPMTLVTRSPRASHRCRWCVTGTTTIRFPRATVIKRFWRRDMSTGSRSPVAARQSPPTGCDHRSDNLADAGNLVEQPGHLILRLGVGDFVLQIVDRFVEPLKSMSQNLCARPGGVRERRVTFDEIKQLVDAADSSLS
jgi:hypothetical protein